MSTEPNDPWTPKHEWMDLFLLDRYHDWHTLEVLTMDMDEWMGLSPQELDEWCNASPAVQQNLIRRLVQEIGK